MSVRLGDHIGHFFDSRDEWRELFVPFLQTGLERGDKCVYLLPDGDRRNDFDAALTGAGIDLVSVLETGQLEVLPGRPDPPAHRRLLAEAVLGLSSRYPVLRWGADMTWTHAMQLDRESLVDWECHCNEVDSDRVVYLCQYDLTRFTGTSVMDALRTHPLCIVNRLIHRNPYYVAAKDFRQLVSEAADS